MRISDWSSDVCSSDLKTLSADPLTGRVGIAHTRWATHGAPTTSNAHPHATLEVSLVHNGIIENFKELREELQACGRSFESQTDTEMAAHLISRAIEAGATPEQAVSRPLQRLPGAFPPARLFRPPPDLLIGPPPGPPPGTGLGDRQ